MDNIVFGQNNASGDGFYDPASYSTASTQGNQQFFTAQQQPFAPPAAMSAPTSFEDEPPLLEELGINIDHILRKAKMVINPFTRYSADFADEADMSGPLAFCLLLGTFLLLSGGVRFGVIYGYATVGCVSMYLIFNFMCETQIDLYRSTSILGYALLPMVFLALIAIFVDLKKRGILGISIGAVFIVWCTNTAANIFTACLRMKDQFWLVAYPLALLYTSFALITIF
eukprot:Plantae.Rhodophyta-Purpureofilum_apyrenoidigerum.ctg21659.p1 GENE.Plantae.Rhodophyta-Purpureofilum_apyrenoidigerum.ctg21659~~Plantae.Rhodophyta-Purpureofilum_apyrenoidigerum.ctg21659.p1  ORF type:complete len:227 (-),score=38.71 Plantae.Rhodophyta-Purpureofilum_apyrenoidigerum.ctg21659:228-908(-)